MIYNYEYQINTDQYMMEAVDMVKTNAKRKLEDLLIDLKKKYPNPTYKFKTIASFNVLTDEVSNLSTTYDIDMIVMGTKGSSKAREVLFGSNTTHVIKKAKRLVLAIPENFDFEIPKEILFATDYKVAYNDTILKPVLEIVETCDPRIHFLHVLHDKDLETAQEKNKQLLADHFEGTAYLLNMMSSQKLSEAIKDFQLRAKINLLVMTNTRYSSFEKLFSKSAIQKKTN